MENCPKCGREPAEGLRFCTECGTDLGEAPDSDVTRIDVPAEVTRTDTPAARRAEPAAEPEDDPFASWFVPDRPAGAPGQSAPGQQGPGQQGPGQQGPGQQGPGQSAPGGPGPGQQGPGGPFGQWQPTETLLAGGSAPGGTAQPGTGAAQPGTGHPAPSQAGPVYPQGPGYPSGPGYPPGPERRSSGGHRTAFFLAGLLVVLAAGGGAYALVSLAGKGSTSQPSAGATTQATSPAHSTPASPAGTGSASGIPTGSATSPAAPGGVALAPGVAGNAAAPQAQSLLGHYFHGINTHNYGEYAATLDAGMRAAQPESQFNSGYATTRDSGMRLTSLASAANGQLAATVTFTSRQDPAQSVDHSACNNWTLTLYLVRAGSGYEITHAPSGYHPTYSDC